MVNPYVKFYGRTAREHDDRRFQIANESLNLYHDIKSYQNESFFTESYKNICFLFASSLSKYQTLCISYKYILESTALIALITILFFASTNSSFPLAFGEIATFAFAAYKLQPSLTSVAVSFNAISYGQPIIERITELRKLADLTTKSDETSVNYELTNNPTSLIQLRDISYEYLELDPTTSSRKILIPDFEVPNVGLLALVGPSGSGKSTCLILLV